MQPERSKLTIGISSRALFNLNNSHEIFINEGVDAYKNYQIKNENKILEPGDGFSLVKKILNLNSYFSDDQRIEVVLLSRNTADTGLRVFNSIEEYGLNISRAVFCGGESPYKYVEAFEVDLFLSASTEDVKRAIENGVAAAKILSSKSRPLSKDKELRIAFDGDSVIFSDEAEKLFEEKGLKAFLENEKQSRSPLKAGPFKLFLIELNKIQSELDPDVCPIRTALVTARSAPSHKRVIETLRDWGVRIDESLFLGGMDKGEFLSSFNADIFFDDQHKNIEEASDKVAAGHVLYGVKNK